MHRRDFLRAVFLGAAGAALPAWARFGDALPPLAPGPLAGAGALVDTGVDGIRAAAGFGLRAVARHLHNPVNGRLDPLGISGYAWHKAPDGGGCFKAADGGWVYVSNCESKSAGGVGALRFDREGHIVDAYRILDGTRRNCAGGVTPWGSWLSCEEVGDGLVYECDPFGSPQTARVWPALGRFNHEAATADVTTRSVYMTEDAADGRLYRFLSTGLRQDRTAPTLDLADGRLQVLEIEGLARGGYTDDDAAMRRPRPATWVDVLEPERAQGELRAQFADHGRSAPGSVFRGAEGLWLHELPPDLRRRPPGGRVPTRALLFFACKLDNRVYALDLDNQLIQTVFDNSAIDLPMNSVDNLVVSPAGDVIVTEDGDATRLVVIVPGGRAVTLLRADHADSELTGPAFSPDGSRLYFSSQRGPASSWLPRGTGVTYELHIPEAFRRR
jgi:uncharacterized protein